MNVIGGRRPPSWQETHIVVPAVGACWRCGQETRFIQVDFQTYLHPGECTADTWRDYDAANRAGLSRYLSIAPKPF